MAEKIFKLEDLPKASQDNIKQLCEDLKSDKRFNITSKEAIKRLNDSWKGMIGYKI